MQLFLLCSKKDLYYNWHLIYAIDILLLLRHDALKDTTMYALRYGDIFDFEPSFFNKSGREEGFLEFQLRKLNNLGFLWGRSITTVELTNW